MFPSGPLVVGIADEYPRFHFDAPAEGQSTTSPVALFIGDLDGPGLQRDDLVVSRSAGLSVFKSIVTPGYISIPASPLPAQSLTPAPTPGITTFAVGDYNNDQRLDVFSAVAGGKIAKFRGVGTGSFASDGAAFGTSGPMAVQGRTLFVVSGGRLRLYDPTCVLPPAGFPSTEVFDKDDLCASVAVAAAPSSPMRFMTVGARSFVVFATTTTAGNTTLRSYEIVRSGGAVNVVARATTALGAVEIKDIATSGSLVLWARSDGSVDGRLFDVTAWLSSPGITPFAPGSTVLSFARIGTFNGATALAVVDSTPAVHVIPFSTSTGWDRDDTVTVELPKVPVLGMQLGQFNDDSLLDIALLTDSRVMIVRQQPPPCATYITAPMHGMQGFVGLPDSGATAVVDIARFNKQLLDRVVAMNADRRPANGFRDVAGALPEQCPVRFIDVRGNWETLSAEASLPAYVARAAWLGSMLVPLPFPTPIPTPALFPVDYWIGTGLHILNPPVAPVAATRLALAGVGLTVGQGARWTASDAGLRAARRLNAVINAAIVDADDKMDQCTGQIFVDLVGQSRGTAVLTQALREGLSTRSRYNFEVSTTLLDAVDSTGPWSLLPHIRGGYIVGDPAITRVGSEWNSNFYGDRAEDENDLLNTLVLAVPPFIGDVEYRRAEVIGLPKGRPGRESELADPDRTFGAYAGPIMALNHSEFFRSERGGFIYSSTTGTTDYIDAPSDEVGRNAFPTFAFIHTTHLGAQLQNPRGDIRDGVGFGDLPRGEAEELACLPDACGGTGACSTWETVDNTIEQELVVDGDHRKKSGALRSAQDLVSTDPTLKTTIPQAEFELLRTWILTTVANSWPDEMGWTHTGGVTVSPAVEDVATSMRPFVAQPGVDYSTVDTEAEWNALSAQASAELSGLSASEQKDRTETLAAAAGRLTAAGSPSLNFSSSGGTARTTLHSTSQKAPELFVRVEMQMLSASSSSGVGLDIVGAGINRHVEWNGTSGTGRQVAEISITRGAVTAEQLDTLVLKGKNARVFAVSVQAREPYVASTGSAYEFVQLEDGVTAPRAANLAARRMYNGKQGRLLRQPSVALLDELADKLKPNGYGLIDATSSTGQAGSFVDSKGNALDPAVFLSSTSFAAARPRGAQAFTWPKDLGARVGHSHPGVMVNGEKLGFWVEYGGVSGVSARSASASATSVPEEAGVLDAIAAFFADLFADEENEEAAGPEVEATVVTAAVAVCDSLIDGACPVQ